MSSSASSNQHHQRSSSSRSSRHRHRQTSQTSRSSSSIPFRQFIFVLSNNPRVLEPTLMDEPPQVTNPYIELFMLINLL